MKVRCIQTEINKDKKSLFGIDADFDPCFQITIGKECTVFGISIIHGKSGYSGLVMYEILDDVRSYCISMPHCLFEIIDGRASSYWEIRINNEDITIWPEDFFAIISLMIFQMVNHWQERNLMKFLKKCKMNTHRNKMARGCSKNNNRKLYTGPK